MIIECRDKNLPQINFSGGVLLCEGKILFINKNEKWDLPKGKLEEGESLATCAVRETSEQTGENCQSSDILELPIVRESMTGLNIRN